MKNNNKTLLDNILEGLSILLLAIGAGFTAYNRGSITEFPMHFDFNGKFDTFSNSTFAIYTIIGLAAIGLIGLLITANRDVAINKTSPRLIRVLALELMVLATYIQVSTVIAVTNNQTTIGASYFIILGIIFATVIYGTVKGYLKKA